MSAIEELRRRLRRTDLLLYNAVRRMRARPQNTARGQMWGFHITDDDVDDLLRAADEIRLPPDAALLSPKLAENLRLSEILRDEPGPLMDGLRAEHGLDALDVDILLLALLPDVAEGYGRVLAWLNDYATMPWATADLAARVLAPRRVGRLRVLRRLLPDAPLMRGGLLELLPLDPHVQPLVWHRLSVARPLAATLLGLDPNEGEAETPLLHLMDPDLIPVEEPAVDDPDTGGELKPGLFRDLAARWRRFFQSPSLPPPRKEEAPRKDDEGGGPAAQPPWRRSAHPGPPEPEGPSAHLPDLARRLVRADLLLLHAVRQHREMPWVAENARGRDVMNLSVIGDREINDLLWHRGDPVSRAVTGLEEHLSDTRALRDGPEGRLGELALRCDLESVDLDILSLVLLPEIAQGYRRIFAFLNAFAHDHLTVGLLARILGKDASERWAVRARLVPGRPLIEHDLVVLNTVFPGQDYLPARRIGLARPVLEYLLGEGLAPGRAPGKVIEMSALRAHRREA